MPSRPLKVFLCHARADRDAVRALHSRLTNDGVDAWLIRRGIGNPRLSAWKPCGLTAQSPNGLPRTEQGISIPLTHARADRDAVRALHSRLTKDGVDAWTRRGIENPRLSAWKPCGLIAQSPKDFHELSRDFNPAHCYAHADRDPVRTLYSRLTTPALAGGAREDGVDAWLDKEKLLPGQDWEFEIRKVVHTIG